TEKVPARNVVGFLPGRDPLLAREVLLLGAHYDHVGLGRFGSLGGTGRIHPGADDNASGTAAVLELAEWFAVPAHRPRRSLLFVLFSGEEKGLLGSRHYVEHPVVPLDDTVAMLNLDMVGRSQGRLHVGGVGTGWGLEALVRLANETYGFDLSTRSSGVAPTDSMVFFRRHLPVLFFFTGMHGDYHRPSDTADRIDYASQVRVTLLALDVARALADGDERLVYTEPPPPKQRPVLGIRLDRTPETRGVLLAGVIPKGPAARAGLRAGDVIVALAGHVVKQRRDLLQTLGDMKPGESVPIVVLRGEERIETAIVPGARGRK
ncbi:MAG: M20/M25/M40 family metallo-hydrolase, partial [Planctomycetota bacterium]